MEDDNNKVSTIVPPPQENNPENLNDDDDKPNPKPVALSTARSPRMSFQPDVPIPYRLIPTSAHDVYIEGIDIVNYEKSIQTQLKSAWSSLGSIFAGDENSPPPPPKRKLLNGSNIYNNDQEPKPALDKKLDSTYLVDIYKNLTTAPTKQHGVTIKTMTQVKEVAELDEARNHLCAFLENEMSIRSKPPALKDFSFYPLKEMLLEVLTVAMDKRDFKSAFIIVYCTQGIELVLNEGEVSLDAKLLSEYYYSQAVVRMKPFWTMAIYTYRAVS